MTFNRLIPPSELSNEDYHKISDMSASTLKMCKINPDYYKLKHKLKSIDSIALDKGTCLHSAVLESDTFNWINFNFKDSDKQLLEVMINNSQVMFPELKNSMNEYSLFIKSDKMVKNARIDIIIKYFGNLYVGDLKSSKCATPDKFKQEAYELDYDIQAAWNYDLLVEAGYNPSGFIFYVQPSIFPYIPFKMECDEYFIESGREKYGKILDDIFKENTPIHTLTLPTYILKNKGIIE